jgi:ribosomal protein L7/L12
VLDESSRNHITHLVKRVAPSESRSSRRSREAIATRLATRPRDDIPAHVIELLVAGKRIQAIKRCSELTGTSLKEAKDLINSL